MTRCFIRSLVLAALIFAGCDEQTGTTNPDDGSDVTDGTTNPDDGSDVTDGTTNPDDGSDVTDGTTNPDDGSDVTDGSGGFPADGPQPGEVYKCDVAFCYVDVNPHDSSTLACFEHPAPRTGDSAYPWWWPVDTAFVTGNCKKVSSQ